MLAFLFLIKQKNISTIILKIYPIGIKNGYMDYSCFIVFNSFYLVNSGIWYS